MFSAAYDVVRNFTRPVIVSTRFANGVVRCGLATFIVVNKDGWVVTAAHVLNDLMMWRRHVIEKKQLEEKRAAIMVDGTLSKGQRRKALDRLVLNREWITNASLWWCQDGAIGQVWHVDSVADVAVVKLDGFDTGGISTFPVFKSPADNPPPAGSLCRLGFPFVEVTATFAEATQEFTLQNFVLPPMFPNDGIHTRLMLLPDPADNRTVTFIETSTPGLRGQSGGPLFDAKGEIWGIQCRTNFLELGFTPRTREGNREIVEHQFMNVGLATHVRHVVDIFVKYGIPYRSA